MTRGRLDAVRELFPVPFLGVVLLLIVLILVTPSLLSTGAPSAGSLQTQAELIVDRSLQENVTHLYLRGLGIVRFASLSIAVATNTSWPVGAAPIYDEIHAGNLTLSLSVVTPANPVAVNVSATFIDAQGVQVVYVGEYAFYVSGPTLETVTLLPSETSVGPTPLTSLPLTLLLPQAPSPGSP